MRQARELAVTSDDGVALRGEVSGEGPPIALLHGLTATRRYVVMGSTVLQRAGLRVVAYDARGHGQSEPAGQTREADHVGRAGSARADERGPALAGERGGYTYERLAGDLRALLDSLEIERAVIAGASMGAHTAIRFALEHPRRVAGLGLITPSYDPDAPGVSEALANWDALARGLREGGIEGFIQAYDLSSIPDTWRSTVEKAIRQRLAEHRHPQAVADALEAVPRSRPFQAICDLRGLAAPTIVIASRDEADPRHPLAVARRYAEAIPGARLVVEDAGPPPRSPTAWQGGQLSRVLVQLTEMARMPSRPHGGSWQTRRGS